MKRTIHKNKSVKNSCILILMLTVFSATFIFAQNNLPYLGQDPPCMTAKRFPPDSLQGIFPGR